MGPGPLQGIELPCTTYRTLMLLSGKKNAGGKAFVGSIVRNLSGGHVLEHSCVLVKTATRKGVSKHRFPNLVLLLRRNLAAGDSRPRLFRQTGW